MGRRARTQRLYIWLNGTPVGYWDAAAGDNTLTYFEEWLADEQGRPLSLSLPFQPGNAPYRGAVVQNYFDNLLPDSDAIRRRLAQHFRTDGIAPHQLLAAVGRDCVGAIQLLPPDETPSDIFSINGEPVDEHGVASLLRRTLSDRPLGQGDEVDDLRLSIAGAQEKSALLWHQGQWQRPIGSTPTTHILKLPLGLVGAMQADMRTSVENEWLCSRIMHGFGLPVAQCELAQFEDMKALVVERFDRRLAADGSWIVRLPQEDFCQATATSPLHKYQADGGPGISRIMEILLGSEQAEQDRANFFKTQLLFWLLAATDGHAKNFSIFHLPGNRYRATPLYDVLSAHPILGTGAGQLAPQRAKLAMAVRGSQNYYHLQQIQRRHWVDHAKLVGLGEVVAEGILNAVLLEAEEVVAMVQAQLPDGYPMDLAEAILQGMLRQLKRLKPM
ncbi:type II toxin-antitoxin system HipA family toxin [Duganella sp. FT80W]|uniref:Type II toxin-antitoxin system HipA family toxin n=1 Tax=Duganella guangzhouensis TaxID=2666084 RepID=A0A6I2L382_9BURK|nr:type II toxin-antitoxin system HipA family toxin [Duganella guangzhouensis]MRW91046.1 type II toxin-antitoxin system HipA family toxin [Duganella guangzhouensis]